MTSYSEQYQPIAADEVDADAAISVRQVRDLASSINNAVVTCAPRWVAMGWPGDKPSSVDGTTETVVLRNIGPVFVGHAYNRLTWSASMKLTSAGTCTWTLYSHWFPYVGADAITTALAAGMGPRVTTTIATTSTTGEIPNVTSHTLFAPPSGQLYLTLTGDHAASGYTCTLDSFSATPWISEA